jgi:hypothetical protein
MSSSTLYTIGTALRRAHDNHLTVSMLVESHWLQGQVAAIDGHGVLLDLEDEGEHSVVRLERISAVRVQGRIPSTPTSEPGEPGEPASHLPAHASLQPV